MSYEFANTAFVAARRFHFRLRSFFEDSKKQVVTYPFSHDAGNFFASDSDNNFSQSLSSG